MAPTGRQQTEGQHDHGLHQASLGTNQGARSTFLTQILHGHMVWAWLVVSQRTALGLLLGLLAEARLFVMCQVTLGMWLPFWASVSSPLKQRGAPGPSVLWPVGPSTIWAPFAPSCGL